MRALIGALTLSLLPIAASAQTGGAALPNLDEQVSRGPMTVEKLHNGFMVAPDFKITEFDGSHVGLVGGYAGYVWQDRFFIGGAAYGAATNTHNRELAYGGLLLQWFGGGNDVVHFGAKLLVGGGHAEIPFDTFYPSPSPPVPVPQGGNGAYTVRVGEDFFVTEPEFNVLVNMSKNVRLALGTGYRFTGSWYGGYYGSPYGYPYGVSYGRLNGFTGTFGVQIHSGS